jgi:DNA-directed RNA polymerase specialized sigma24 family protein
LPVPEDARNEAARSRTCNWRRLACRCRAGPRDLIALDDALNALSAIDERKARLVELRFFGGLSEHETAEAMGVSLRTGEREWAFAKAWLRREKRTGGQA